MIRLLEGHSLTERARFQPESQPLTLNQRQSTTRIVEQQQIVGLSLAVVCNLDTPALDVTPASAFLHHLAAAHVQNELDHVLLIGTFLTDGES